MTYPRDVVRALAGLCLAAAACGRAPDDTGETTSASSDSTMGASTSGSAGSGAVTGTIEPAPCESSAACESGYCVAPYDAAANPPVGPGVCVPACLEPGRLDRACVDDDSCCGDLICDVRALCVEADVGADSTDGGTETTTDTGGTDTTTGN